MTENMNDLADLYERDPLSLSAQDIDTIIRRQREAFTAFQAGVQSAGTSKTKKAAAKPAIDPAKKAAAADLLKDLGLG